MSDIQVFSVPMQLYVMAESAEAALAIANGTSDEVYGAFDDEQTGPHSLYVATDKPSDIDVAH